MGQMSSSRHVMVTSVGQNIRASYVTINEGDISCQFLMPGGSIGPRYVLQLLFSEKSQNC
jgi:hypothetical protein